MSGVTESKYKSIGWCYQTLSRRCHHVTVESASEFLFFRTWPALAFRISFINKRWKIVSNYFLFLKKLFVVLNLFMISNRAVVLSLTFKSFIYFELIVVCGMREGPGFILGAVNIPVSQHYLLKGLFFPHWAILAPLLKSNWLQTYEFISGPSILFRWYMHLFYSTVWVTIVL